MLCVEHLQRGPCLSPRQIRCTLPHHIPKARCTSRRAHRARAPSRALTAELHDAHEAAVFHSAEALHLQSALDAHDAMQTDLARHDAEEATWSMLRTEFTRQVKHMCYLKAVRVRETAELSALMRHGYRGTSREEPHPRALRSCCG